MYIMGAAGYDNDSVAVVYFDNEDNPLQRFQDEITSISFFVCYDATSGQYLNHGIVPSVNAFPCKSPAKANNRVFGISRCNSFTEYWLTMWQADGTFIKADTIHSIDAVQISSSYGLCSNESGYVFASLLATSPVNFDNNIATNCPVGNSSAVFALYHDPEYAQPHINISSYEEMELPLSLWPNPVQNSLNIRSENSKIECLEIIDVNGRIVMQKQVVDSQAPINVSTLPAGLYFLRAVCDDATHIERFVKTNY